jgi:hypothetical protein
METLEDVAPNHSILQPGSVVAIGLDKSTKLSAVFRRFCEFLNEQYPSVKLIYFKFPSRDAIVESFLETIKNQKVCIASYTGSINFESATGHAA